MEREWLSRTAMLLGEDAVERLRNSRVAVFGVGGVGGYVVEALVRCGVGSLELVDNDTVAESNLNRQIIALRSTIGMPKVEAAAARARDIDPTVDITASQCFFLPETAHNFDFSRYDYVVDAIDTVSGKLEIISRAKAAGTPVISSMGTGNLTDPTSFRVADIFKTSVCPLARVMRRELRQRGIDSLKVVYSEQTPARAVTPPPDPESGKTPPASCAFMPSVAGLIIASEVVKDLTKKN